MFWEFATDHYDVGFGVYFEWTIAENNNIVVQVSESSDGEMDEESEAVAAPQGDVEGAGAHVKPRDLSKPLVDEVIPVYRRDCYEEVFLIYKMIFFVVFRFMPAVMSILVREFIYSSLTIHIHCGVRKPFIIEYFTVNNK